MTMYLLGAVVRLWRRMFKGGIDRWERGRLRSIAAASAPLHGEVLPPVDRALVDAHHEILVESRTAEYPVLPQVRRRHVYRPPNARQAATIARRRAAPREAFEADPLSAPLAGPLAPAVVASSVRSFEPEPWHLESFTTGWTAAEFAALLATAGAR